MLSSFSKQLGEEGRVASVGALELLPCMATHKSNAGRCMLQAVPTPAVDEPVEGSAEPPEAIGSTWLKPPRPLRWAARRSTRLFINKMASEV